MKTVPLLEAFGQKFSQITYTRVGLRGVEHRVVQFAELDFEAALLGDFERVLDYRRDLHRRSRDALTAGLEEHLPGWRLPRTDGGVAAWVELGGAHSSALAIAARDRGLLIGAGPWFGLEGEFERFIRIPITATPHAIERAVRILADAWASLPSTRDASAAAVL